MKNNRIPLKDLNLIDRFLFDNVVEDSSIQQDILSIILGKDVSVLSVNETEKELRVSPQLRSVRLDVFSMDQDLTIYNTEMQKSWKADLAKRSRYYQGIVDTTLLEPGVPNYNQPNDSYIILIMPFDLFGLGKYCYTFRSRCEESPDCVLNDGAVRIFLNTKGQNDLEVSKELIDFLHYVEDSSEKNALNSCSERIHRIHQRVCSVKSNEETGVKYMQAWEERYYELEEAKEEGLKAGLETGRKAEKLDLIKKKLDKGKSVEAIADALEEDVETIQKLIAELPL